MRREFLGEPLDEMNVCKINHLQKKFFEKFILLQLCFIFSFSSLLILAAYWRRCCTVVIVDEQWSSAHVVLWCGVP